MKHALNGRNKERVKEKNSEQNTLLHTVKCELKRKKGEKPKRNEIYINYNLDRIINVYGKISMCACDCSKNRESSKMQLVNHFITLKFQSFYIAIAADALIAHFHFLYTFLVFGILLAVFSIFDVGLNAFFLHI